MAPAVSFAAKAKAKGDQEKAFAAINKMSIEDATLRLRRDNQTGETILSGMGQVRLGAALEKIKRKRGAKVILKAPKEACKEAIKGRAKVQGKHKAQGKRKTRTGGKERHGGAAIELGPAPPRRGLHLRGQESRRRHPPPAHPGGGEGLWRLIGPRRPGRSLPARRDGLVPGGADGEGLGRLSQRRPIRLELDHDLGPL